MAVASVQGNQSCAVAPTSLTAVLRRFKRVPRPCSLRNRFEERFPPESRRKNLAMVPQHNFDFKNLAMVPQHNFENCGVHTGLIRAVRWRPSIAPWLITPSVSISCSPIVAHALVPRRGTCSSKLRANRIISPAHVASYARCLPFSSMIAGGMRQCRNFCNNSTPPGGPLKSGCWIFFL